MNPNPILRRLGYSDTDRVVIFHADDIGNSQSSLAAYQDIVAFGVMSSAATMVPCPWFPATAAFYRAQPAPGPDLGIHLTLNSEWGGYRWGPISTCDPASGLLDDQGYLHRRTEPVRLHGRADAIAAELRAQVARATAAGIEPTHVDSHMFCLLHPRLLPIYLDLARELRLPPFVPRLDLAALLDWGFDAEAAQTMLDLLREAEHDGLPLFDHVAEMSLTDPDDRLAQAKAHLAAIPPGLTNFIFHPSHDTPELAAMARDWRCRVADHALFTAEAWRAAVRDAGIQVIGFRALRDAVRSAP